MAIALDDARAKIGRADYHLNHIETQVRAFFRTEPRPIAFETRHEGGDNLLCFRVVRSLPLRDWGVEIGDCIHNARATLDYLAWQLAIAHTPNLAFDDRTTGFPIFDDPGKVSDVERRIKYMSRRAQTIIKRLQPYNRGDPSHHPLWVLNKLDIADKHKVLALTAYFLKDAYARLFYPPDILPPAFSRLADGPLEDGTVFSRFTKTDDPRVHVESYFYYSIGFADGAAQGLEVFDTLRILLRYVRRVIEIVARLFLIDP
jgi:hypothetical protein